MTVVINSALDAQRSLTVLDCWKCAAFYALTDEFIARARKDGKGWHCPYCQASTVFTETENDRLRKQLEAQKRETQRQREQADWNRQKAELSERRRRAAKGQVTRIKNRVSHGVCPCCSRTFQNLARHMATKHPGYHKEDAEGQ